LFQTKSFSLHKVRTGRNAEYIVVIAEGNTVPESTRVTRFSSAVTSDKDNIRTCDFSTLCDEFWTAL